jgi:hypothetical protein
MCLQCLEWCLLGFLRINPLYPWLGVYGFSLVLAWLSSPQIILCW